MKVLIAEARSGYAEDTGALSQEGRVPGGRGGDGAAAVDFLAERQVDLVVLDWMMPVQNGLDTCREIRRLNIPVKILMLTAKGQNEDEIAGLSCGADDYLRKPFDMQVLLLRVKKLCNAEGVLRCGKLTLKPGNWGGGSGGARLS